MQAVAPRARSQRICLRKHHRHVCRAPAPLPRLACVTAACKVGASEMAFVWPVPLRACAWPRAWSAYLVITYRLSSRCACTAEHSWLQPAPPSRRSKEFVIDGKEIRAAHWVAWRPLLERWIASGRPQQKRVAFEGFGELVGLAELKPEKNLVMCNVLHWLETWVDGRGFSVARKRSQQGKDHVTKALFNACF